MAVNPENIRNPYLIKQLAYEDDAKSVVQLPIVKVYMIYQRFQFNIGAAVSKYFCLGFSSKFHDFGRFKLFYCFVRILQKNKKHYHMETPMKNRAKSKSILQVMSLALGMLGTAGAYETTQDLGLSDGDLRSGALSHMPEVERFLEIPSSYRYSYWVDLPRDLKVLLYPLLNEDDRRSVMVPRKIRDSSENLFYGEKMSHNDKLLNFPCIPAKERFEFWKKECSPSEQSEMFKYLDEIDQYSAFRSLSAVAQEENREYLGHPVRGWNGYGEDNRPWELYDPSDEPCEWVIDGGSTSPRVLKGTLPKTWRR